jgi:hypothetical protein
MSGPTARPTFPKREVPRDKIRGECGSTRRREKIAAEMNLAETAFVPPFRPPREWGETICKVCMERMLYAKCAE